MSDEYAIYKTIFASYNNDVKPETSSAIEVFVALRFFTLLYMNQQEELITFSGDFEMDWLDPSLKWSPASYGGRSVIHVPETYVWRPDITVYNSVEQTEVIDEAKRRVSILSDGDVQLSNPSIYTTLCTLNVNAFPFDTQTCMLKLSSWVYGASELVIIPPNDTLANDKENFIGNGEWDVVEAFVRPVTTYDTDGTPYQEIAYQIKLKRKAAYYISVLLIPTFIVSALCILGLFTPFDNIGTRTERVTLGLTTLLALAVMLTLVAGDMPKSTTLPHLGSYVLAEIILCGIGVIITIVIQFSHQRVNTRMILPFVKKHRRQFREKHRLLHVVHGDNTVNSNEYQQVIRDTHKYIKRLEYKEELRLYWVRFFDTIDILLLLIFQTVNVLLTLCYLFIR